jgi:hypothetical protein
MKKLLLIALFCGFLVSSTIGCNSEPTKAAPAPTPEKK